MPDKDEVSGTFKAKTDPKNGDQEKQDPERVRRTEQSRSPRQGRQRQGRQQDERTTDQRIADLELQLATVKATVPLGTIPDHAGGVGQEIEPTWSQQDQEMAARGEHPFQDDDEDGGIDEEGPPIEEGGEEEVPPPARSQPHSGIQPGTRSARP